MLRSHHDYRGFAVDSWQQASGQKPSQDKALVEPRGDLLRLAAVDGTTPHPDAERYMGADSAMAGATTVALALRAAETIEAGYAEANAVLYGEAEQSWLRPRASAICADVRLKGGLLQAQVVRAGDCVCYVRGEEGWQALLGDPETAEERARKIAQYGHLSLDEVLRSVNDDPTALVEHPTHQAQPVGTLPEPQLEEASVMGVLELILASDGARLDLERVAQLEEWLAGLREHERSSGEVEPWKPHDDVTVIRVRPR